MQGYAPGLIGVSHGALQFMAYEELKKGYSQYFGTPINKKLVIKYKCHIFIETFRLRLEQRRSKKKKKKHMQADLQFKQTLKIGLQCVHVAYKLCMYLSHLIPHDCSPISFHFHSALLLQAVCFMHGLCLPSGA